MYKPAALRTTEREAALAGFLRCAQCGCQITYDPKSRDGRVYHYYRRSNGKKQHSKLVYVTEEAIMRGFASAAESIAIDVVIADELSRILNDAHASTRAERRRQSAKSQRELEDIDANESKLYDLLSSGTIDEPSYKRPLQRSNASATAAPKPRRSSRRPTRTWTTPSSPPCEAL